MNRLESVKFVDCCWLFSSPQRKYVDPFFPIVAHAPASTSFSWAFTPSIGGYANAGHPLPPLESLRISQVFGHPAVLANGIDLLVGDRSEDRKAIARDLKSLPEELRRLVRY
jgi:hypothetical protein